MNVLSAKRREEIIKLLCEGNSHRGIQRITGTHHETIEAILKVVGLSCLKFHEEQVTNLPIKSVQCDECWSFVYCKDKNVPARLKGKKGYGDIHTWIAMDAKTRLILTWHAGNRGTEDASIFMNQLAKKVSSRFQLTTDGHKPYLEAIEKTFGNSIDYAMNHKIYKATRVNKTDTRFTGEHSFNAEKCVVSIKKIISGKPELSLVSTSHIERQNLTMRMHSKRFSRATIAFSKKFENHCYALALQFMYYNFCKIHKTLRVTPAMEAGLSKDIWTAADIVKLAYKD